MLAAVVSAKVKSTDRVARSSGGEFSHTHREQIVNRRYASLEEAASYLGCNIRTIRRRIAAGELTGYRLGSRIIRVDLEEVNALLEPIPTVKAG
jgi:excisionase family DNA binding protein